MTQNSNQFALTQEKGQLTLGMNLNVISGKIASAESGTGVPGSALKIANIAGDVINFLLATNTTDDVFGFIPHNVKVSSYVANDAVKVAFDGCIMVMEAGAAITPGADLEYVVTGQKVQTQATGTTIGKALTKASADGDLILVLVKTPRV